MSTPSAARQRVLDTATRLFYAEGIRAVGVDRIVTEAGVTRATFYRHFPGKEELVRAYIQEWDARIRSEAGAALAALTPVQALTMLVTRLGQEMCGPGFRGCPFINAAAEYPDAGHPVTRAIAEHRAWLRALLGELLAAVGVPEPERRADLLVLLRDGAMVGAALGDPAAVVAQLADAVAELVGLGPAGAVSGAARP
ncbi:AcrR family transcriptional regulator [Kitasatospora sp. GAS204A]|uniref:TetR/AcrR family transcriptional regulator n=1 Tax=unclassified Kitasatospora TaxID=2633591 RepID=UPI0024769574|nr:TetR/AcrR family transcriptional regulator [Kitasatospora sp. GAS204B]MDH6116122.1 AcrR family transcriptional regulator [Kitasatospora sp. GAS204B]